MKRFFIILCGVLCCLQLAWAAPGDTCSEPIVLDQSNLPYTDTNTNCGRLDSENTTCLENWDKGEDIFYQLTLSSDTGLTVTVDPKGTSYGAFLIDDTCPPDATDCLFTVTNGSEGTPMTSGHIDLPAGTYFIMIDTFATPDCIPDFDLSIVESIAPTPTPTMTPSGVGGNCGWPIVVNQAELPWTDATQTNCGLANNYEETCLAGYDGGEDIIYQLNIGSDTGLNITLDPGTTAWTGLVFDDNCPPDADDCIMEIHNFSSGAYSTDCFNITAGTYYIMVDTNPSPDCIPSFDLTIEECVVPTATPTMTPIDCTGALPEGEENCSDDYEDTTNIGCNTGTLWSIFTTLGCGESICGTSGTYDYYGEPARDTDWFEYDVPINTQVTLTLETSFDADFYIGDYNDCSNQIELDYVHVLAGTTVARTLTMGPGTYHAYVAPDDFTGVECGRDYRLSLDCANVTPTPIPPTPTAYPFCQAGRNYPNTTGGAIPDNGCGSDPLESVTSVSDVFDVTGVTVKLSINHPHLSDLEAILRGPDGTSVMLFSDVGGGGDNFVDTVFTDESAIPVGDGSAPFPYSYHPEEDLSAFIGLQASGNWTLELCDDASADLGNLVEWELCLEGQAPQPIPSTSVWGLLAMLGLLGGVLVGRRR